VAFKTQSFFADYFLKVHLDHSPKIKSFYFLFLLDDGRIQIRICALTNGSDPEHCSASVWKIFFETLCAADLFSESYFQLCVSGQLCLLLCSWISVDLLFKE
jgi:hypothetical protein